MRKLYFILPLILFLSTILGAANCHAQNSVTPQQLEQIFKRLEQAESKIKELTSQNENLLKKIDAGKGPEQVKSNGSGTTAATLTSSTTEHEKSKGFIITSEKSKSPTFLLGKETGPNMSIVSQDNPNLKFHLGVRFMGTAEFSDTDNNDGEGAGEGGWDFYARRARLEAGASISKDTMFYMDIRNDRVNQDDRGEGNFTLGDAKLTVKNLNDKSWLNAAFYRAKVDVSRTETIKSSNLVEYDRPEVADSAANWVSHNRRAANAQLFGDFKKKVHYQLAVGDGVASSSFFDAKGEKADGIDRNTAPMLGGKILISPFDGWEELEKTETYFGQGKHLSLGVGQFYAHGIKLEATSESGITEVDRALTNVEFSTHYYNALLQAEWFNFEGAVEDLSADTLNVSGAGGWYVLGEYVIPEFNYVAPFVRYDYWDTFRSVNGHVRKGPSVGVNWYLMGNSAKVGFIYQSESEGEAIGDQDSNSYRVVSQFFF